MINEQDDAVPGLAPEVDMRTDEETRRLLVGEVYTAAYFDWIWRVSSPIVRAALMMHALKAGDWRFIFGMLDAHHARYLPLPPEGEWEDQPMPDLLAEGQAAYCRMVGALVDERDAQTVLAVAARLTFDPRPEARTLRRQARWLAALLADRQRRRGA
jgi:hypothetical protein